MPLHVVDHPFAQILTTRLRDKNTGSESFRIASRRITQLLILEATRSLPIKPLKVETPIEETQGASWATDMTLVPILRAGISMVEPILDFFPDATVGYLGLERDEKTAVARNYYCKIPSLKDRITFIVDPMLATGGSTIQAIDACMEKEAQDMRVITIISAPEGIAAIERAYPGTQVYSAALDRELNNQKYILPGLGDFGDRHCNT